MGDLLVGGRPETLKYYNVDFIRFQSLTDEFCILGGTWMVAMQTKRINLNTPSCKIDALLHKFNSMPGHFFRRRNDSVDLLA
jgi:hypothetical protein